jgi:hypothetical protein
MTQLIGVDISKWDYGWNPSNATETIHFVIQRASYGQTKDEKFDEMLSSVKMIPVRGCYHYFSSHINWKVQADFFLNVTKNGGFHFYIVDYEAAFNTLDGRTYAELYEFVKYVKEKTGRRCLIYFSPSIYSEKLRPYGANEWINLEDIWIAQYPLSNLIYPTKPPVLPVGVTTWKIHQYGGADVSGTPGRHAGAAFGAAREGIDLNIANFETVDDFQSWAGADGTIDPPDEPPVEEKSNLYTFADNQYYSRHGGPLTCPMSRVTRMGDNINPIEWVSMWLTYFKALGNTSKAIEKIVAPDVGPSKGMSGTKLRYIGLLWPGRNVVRITEQIDGVDGRLWGKVETLSDSDIPSAALVNRFDTPHLVQEMYGYHPANKYYRLPFRCYLPILSDTGFYVPMECLKSVDDMLPTIVFVRAFPYLNERSGAGVSYPVVKRHYYNATIRIVYICIAKGGIWGKTDRGGYVALRYNDNNFTSFCI